MKIAILGGGMTGLTSAFYLSQQKHEITVIEKGAGLGGLAGGFREPGWEWELERTYHHIFSTDDAILQLAQEISFQTFSFSQPQTASLFGRENNYRIFPIDSPKDFLFLPELSFFAKIRAGLSLLFLKLSPFLSWFERITAEEFLKKTMGEEAWIVLWKQLFRKKYGKYAGNILASFIWARIKKRTQQLGYPMGGFQAFINALAAADRARGVNIIHSSSITQVHKKGEKYVISYIDGGGSVVELEVDSIISTLPYPITCSVMQDILGENYVKEQGKRKYLWAVNLILKTKRPLLSQTYWLNISATDIPIMCLVQHTHFVDKKHYDNAEICYVAWYVEEGSELLKKNSTEMATFALPYLKKIAPALDEVPEVVALFKAPYAQPIFDAEFTTIPRSFATPAKNIYVANMDMTYPYDRGTNYAVQLGKDVSNLIKKI